MKQVFYITVNEITLFHWRKQRIVHSYRFGIDDKGFAELSGYLAKAPELPTSAIVDIVEEEFQLESVPRVSGKDRTNLLNRKLRQRFMDVGYTTAVSHGRSESNPLQEEVLLSTLNNSEVLDRFLGLVDKFRVPLKGVYSAAYIAELVYNRLHNDQEQSLLINILPNGYSRQSFFSKNKLKASRLSALEATSGEPLAQKIMGEIHKKQRYLDRIRLLPLENRIDVNIICPENVREDLMTLLKDNGQIQFHFVSMAELLGKLKLENEPENTDIPACFAHVVSTQKVKGNYVSIRKRRYHLFRKINQGLMAASLLLALGAMILGTNNYMNALDYESRAVVAERNSLYFQRRLQQAQKLKPEIEFTAQGLRSTIRTWDRLNKVHFPPERAFRFVSGTLRQFPSITLESLQWETVRFKLQGKIGSRGVRMSSTKHVVLKPGMRVIRIKGRIPGFQGNYINAFDRVKRLIASIKQNRMVLQVKPVSMPVNTNARNDVSGYSGSAMGSKSAQFELMVVLREEA